jgi:hypothetical protein
MRRLAPLAALLALGACHQAPVSHGPRPVALAGPKVGYAVDQAAVDRAIPVGVDAYEGTEVTWAGSQPEAVILERFVRGKCFLRERFTEASDGRFHLAAIPAKGGATGGPVKKGQLLLADVEDGPAGRGQAHVERDPLGHVAWVYQVEKATRAGQPPLEVVTQFRYDVHGCELPRVLDRGAIPPKVRPAGVGSPTPGSQ